MPPAPQQSISRRAWAELLLLALIWGGVFVATRIAIDEVGVFTSIAHRTVWASVILWAVVVALRLPLPRSARHWRAFYVMGVLNNIIPFGLITWGQLHIESGLASILNATTAVFGVLVAAAVFADERLTWNKAAGVTLGLVGVIVTIGPANLTDLDPRNLGQLAVLGAAVSYAFAGAWARRHLTGVPPQVAAAGMLTASATIALPAALILDGPINLNLAPVTWAAIAYYSVAATALAYLLYYRVLAMAGSGNLLLVTLLMPPIAIALGAWLRAESLPPAAYAGFGLIALGLMVLDGRALRAFQRRR